MLWLGLRPRAARSSTNVQTLRTVRNEHTLLSYNASLIVCPHLLKPLLIATDGGWLMIAGHCPHRRRASKWLWCFQNIYQSVGCMDLASLAIVDQPQATCTLKPFINLKTYFLGEVQTAGKLYAWPWQQFSTFIHCNAFYHSGMLWPFQLQYYHRIAPFPKLKCLCGLSGSSAAVDNALYAAG